MRMTLLEMVQDILEALNGDEINSIGDSNEALQVAGEIKTAYYTLLGQSDQPYQEGPIQLIPSGDTDRPTHMQLPDNVKQVKWVRYNDTSENTNTWKEVKYIDPETFLKQSLYLSNQSAVKEVVDFSDIKLYVKTDETPKYYTTFDEQWLIFDGYNSSLDSTLQNDKTAVWASTVPVWEETDSFVPKLRVDLFPLLMSEARSAAFINIKQVANSKDEQRARRLSTQHQNEKHRIKAKQADSRSENDYSRP